jgi:cell division septum initiation protein DivIVA
MCTRVANSLAIASPQLPDRGSRLAIASQGVLRMSYKHESDPQQPPLDGGVEETEAYQPTAEWDAMSEPEAWPQGASDDDWDEHSDDAWHDGSQPDEWEHADGYEHYDDGEPPAAGGVGAKQTLSVAATKITRWFSGLDRRPEYEEHFAGGDPVAEVEPATADGGEAFPTRSRGAAGGRRAAAERAIAANRRRSIAASREGARSGAALSRGSGHASRALRSARDRVVVSPQPADVEEPADEPLPELMGGEGSARFAVTPLGYSRQAVDEHIAALERELAELRESGPRAPVVEPPMSIQEELERIGEETASILVVAHDKAHETTRLAQEQAERCISDAAANAVAITDEAKRKLRELEAETETVRRQRERLIVDARNVAASLVALADEADRRFPKQPPEAESAPSAAGDTAPAGGDAAPAAAPAPTAAAPSMPPPPIQDATTGSAPRWAQ